MSNNVGGDSGKIDDLADREQFYKEQLNTILDAVERAVTNTLSEWYGDSTELFKENYDTFDNLRKDVDLAFDEVILETRNAADNWRMTTASLNNKFAI